PLVLFILHPSAFSLPEISPLKTSTERTRLRKQQQHPTKQRNQRAPHMRTLPTLPGSFVVIILAGPLFAASYPAPQEGDLIVPNFRFRSGETLPELRLHYRTIGTPRKNAAGQVDNAVLVLHGTGGSGTSLLRDSFAGVLFGPGKLLDAAHYYIILPDGIGH